MAFNREWDSSCPRVYERWEADGVSFVIQDLPPEDDEVALRLLMEDLVPDETLCGASEINKDPVSLKSISEFWRMSLEARMSLACYAELGKRTLVGLNCCHVKCKDEKTDPKIEGEGCINVFKALQYIDEKLDVFQYLGTDKLLSAVGLVVKRDYRGKGIAARVLAAREPLALILGINSTTTVFTGPAAQKSAAKAGLHAIFQVTLKELADAGMKYPRDERVLKLMVKTY